MIRRTLALSALLACVVSLVSAAPAAQPLAPSLDDSEGTEQEAAAPLPEARKLLGSIDDGLYRAPSGAYAVPMPKLHGADALVMDTDTVVVFKDKISVLVTIAAFPMPAFARWEYQTKNPGDYLVAFFRDNILRDYTNEFPESRLKT